MFVELAAVLMLFNGPSTPPSLPPPAALRQVRPLSGVAQFLIDEAILRSPTVTRLIAELQRHNVIVYVELDSLRARGATSIISATPKARFLRVVINVHLAPREQIEILGHELHHALEIAQENAVVDESSFREFFDRIGFRTGQGFETEAARIVEGAVRRELSQPSPADRVARSGRSRS